MNLKPNPNSQIAQLLREIDTNQAIQVAKNLEQSSQKRELILRGLDLNSKQLNAISNQLANSMFEVISISYIKNLEPESYIQFLNKLPISVRKIGMVSCGLDDEIGQVLFKTVTRLKKLSTLCVEGNHFSQELKEKFYKLKTCNQNLFLMI